MAFLVPGNPKSTTTTAAAASTTPPPSSYEATQEVTSCLHLKADKGSDGAAAAALERADVLRRIRQQKRINAVRNALRSFLEGSPLEAKDVESTDGWLDDAFSSP